MATQRHTAAEHLRSSSLAAIAAVAAMWSSDPHADTCVRENAVLDVDGVISREAFPSAPNELDRDQGVETEVVFVITSDTPYDLCGPEAESHARGRADGVRRFQLFRSPDLALSQLPVAFGRAHVRGVVTTGLTGRYHTAAAIEVEDFENTGPWLPRASPTYRSIYLPVTITFRRSLVGPGWVARIKNQTSKGLPITATLSSPTTNVSHDVIVSIPSRRTKELGGAGTPALVTGDRILLHSDPYTDVAVVVP